MKAVDCRGLNCPEPVLRAKKAIQESIAGDIEVIVDNQTARENVLRFVKSQGRETRWQEKDGSYHITISEGKTAAAIGRDVTTGAAENVTCRAEGNKGDRENPVLFISTNELGVGSSELGRMLMRNFIYTLTKTDHFPHAIVFMNSGVKLCIEGSPVIDEIGELEDNGVLTLVCGTCLDYFELKDQHKVGRVSNMYDISDLLLAAERVITV